MKNTFSILLAVLGLTLLAGCGIKVGDAIGADGLNIQDRVPSAQFKAMQTQMCGNNGTLRQDPIDQTGHMIDLGLVQNTSRVYVIGYGADTKCAFVGTKRGTILQGDQQESVSYVISASQNCFPQGSFWTGDATDAGGQMTFDLMSQDPAAVGMPQVHARLTVSQDFSLANAFSNFGFTVFSCQ